MLFQRKNNSPDLDEIKGAVERSDDMPFEETNEPAEMELGPSLEQDPMAAPLFVKVEKYREILMHMQEMKLYISGTKQLFALMQELDAIRADAIKTYRASMQRLEKSVQQVDSELLRPRGIMMADFAHGDQDVKHLEDSLSGLQRQLQDLKKELQTLQ
ncbi:MAG: hypothetical protein HY832_03335 [Candidatus Aenigmarchaeota archaeon]|nr:hypothetical protein [Candidatus Aenigmarchaeota archaeon]